MKLIDSICLILKIKIFCEKFHLVEKNVKKKLEF
jgi:hypothetical protein